MTEQQRQPNGTRQKADARVKAIQDEHAALFDVEVALTYLAAAWARVEDARARIGGAS